MHPNLRQSEERIRRFFRDVLEPQLILDRRELAVEHWVVGGEPVSFTEAVGNDFSAFTAGAAWGKPWDTVWFRVTGQVPPEWAKTQAIVELEIDLGYSSKLPGFQAEGTVYDASGRIAKGLEPLNRHVRVAADAGDFTYFIEAAANPNIADDFSFRPTPYGDRETAGDAPLYVGRAFDLVARDAELTELWHDAFALWDVAQQQAEGSARRERIIHALMTVVDLVRPHNLRESIGEARAILAVPLGMPAHASAHTVVAVGHAHLDSAWLWPTRETVRKFARTLANVLDLIETHPEFIFVASSAQQYAWVKEHYPELFDRVVEAVSQGRIVPVGGMWVESDATMVGGESIVRQFLFGESFFRSEFGLESRTVWLPDSFGFSAALPQVFRGVGADSFVTQKLSWNDTNRMPHHTFAWEGIDGSRILTHFPPVDSYMSDLGGADLAKAEQQYAEKSIGTSSIVPFGWGDGGGGPTREMLASGHRKRDLEGSPRVVFGTPADFFDQARREMPNPPVWSGELYLELHRGVFTSQAKTKQGNRTSEALLHEAELWATTALIREGCAYPYDRLEQSWRTVLLQQFHDILPGTSIAWVHQEAERRYREIAADLEVVIDESIAAVAGTGTVDMVAVGNPTAHDAMSVVRRTSGDGFHLVVTGDRVTLRSPAISAAIDGEGNLVSLIDRQTGREFIDVGAPAGVFHLFADRPSQWDAWDIEDHYRRMRLEGGGEPRVTVGDDYVEIERRLGASTVVTRWSLSSRGEALDLSIRVDWREDETLLKVAFPLAVLADRFASETQFGHVYRPTHSNTSWDAARYETVAHRWVYVEEPGAGIAIASASSYGWDVTRREENGRGVGTIVQASLLRSPNFPDPNTDRGEHEFAMSLRPAAGILGAVHEGYRRNLPNRSVVGAQPVQALINASPGSVVVETVKMSHDRSGDVVVRLYESAGAATAIDLTVNFSWASARCVDLLERDRGDRLDQFDAADSIKLSFRPFEIVTLRITPL